MGEDYLGNPLKIGDPVVFMQKNYRGLMTGTVKKLTPKMVIIQHEKTNVCSTETRQYQDQVINLLFMVRPIERGEKL